MKKAIIAAIFSATILASCGTSNTKCENGNCDSTAVQVDTTVIKADSTSTDTTTIK